MPRRAEAGDQNAQWLAQASQLKLRLKMAYKDRDAAYEAMRSELHDKELISELESEERLRSRQRVEEGEHLMKQLLKVKNNVADLRLLIESRGTGAEYVDKLRKAMDVTENEVYVARESQRDRLDALCAEERAISRELAEMEKVFEDWATGEHNRPITASGARSQRDAVDTDEQASRFQIGSRVETIFMPTELPPEVLAVEKILREEGGTTGGWDERDHERFLRYRTQHKGQPHIYIQKTASDLPAHDEESVEAHERWYVRYQALLQAKKNAIRAWRTNKERPRTAAAASDRPTSPTATDTRPKSAFGDRSAGGGSEGVATAATREEQREAVRKWREEKERERQERAAAAAAEERARAAERRRRDATERERERERLLRYKQSKALEAEVRKLQEERDREADRPSVSPEQVQRIRDKNEALTRERALALRRKQEEARAAQAELRDRALAAAAAEVAPPSPPRDPQRIAAPTAASQARRERVLKEMAGEREGAARGHVAVVRPAALLYVPQRATPSWRAGI